MPVISEETFLRVVDRLAAQYDCLIEAEECNTLTRTFASLEVGRCCASQFLLSDLYSGQPRVIGTSVTPGVEGDLITLVLVDPAVPDTPFLLEVFPPFIFVTLATDSAGALLTTWDDIVDAIKADAFAQVFCTVDLFGTCQGNEIAVPQTVIASGGEGDSHLVFTAKIAGAEGNEISIELQDPNAASAEIAVTVTNNREIVVTLATDYLGEIVSTALDVQAAIEADLCGANDLVAVTFTCGDGSGIVEASPAQFLSGGSIGPHDLLVLECSPGGFVDPDVAIPLSEAASIMDATFTARTFSIGTVGFTSMIGALNSHFSRVQQGNLIQGFLTDNDLRVHENFAVLLRDLASTSLDAVNVFRGDEISLGTITVASATLTPGTSLGTGSGIFSADNFAAQEIKLVLQPKQAKAQVIIDPGGSNDNVQFVAKQLGIFGNRLNVAYVDPAMPDQVLSINVVTPDITINLATDGGGSIITTAQQIADAVNAHPTAALLVEAIPQTPGTGVVTAIAQTFLTGGLGPNLNDTFELELTLRDKDNNEATVSGLRFPKDAPYGFTLLVAGFSSFTTTVVTSIDDQMVFTAREPGVDGDLIQVAFVKYPNPSVPLNVSVAGTQIQVILETDGTETIISTARDIKEAIENDPVANSLVRIDLLGDGTGVVGEFSYTNLSGGADPDRYFEVTGVTHTSGTGNGDTIDIRQMVEREIST